MRQTTTRRWLVTACAAWFLTLPGCQDKDSSEPPPAEIPLMQAPMGQPPMMGQPGQPPMMGQVPMPGAMPTSPENMLRAALAKDPENTELRIQLGNILMDTEKFPEAILTYSKVLETQPENTDVRIDMGICYRRVQDSKRAVDEFRKALQYNPNHINGNLNLGVVLYNDLGDTQGALQAWQKFLELAPNHPSAPIVRQQVAEIQASLSQAQ